MSKHKGIVLAGGKGTRLYPATKPTCKQLLPIYDKPLVYYPIATLFLAGIKELLIIGNGPDMPAFERCLGDGSRFGASIQYAVQNEPRGIAEAFLIGEEFIGDSRVCLTLGDGIFYGQSLGLLICNAIRDLDDAKALVTLYEVADPHRYGVAGFDEFGSINSIEEKPSNPKSNYAVTGLYFYPNDVVEFARTLKPSARGELEISDINSIYLSQARLECLKLGRGAAWLDAGTFNSMLDSSNFVATIEKRQGLKIACLEEIAFHNGWITADQCLEAVDDYSNEYGDYVRKVVERSLS